MFTLIVFFDFVLANSNLIVIYADFLIDILKFLTSHPGFEGSFSLDVAMQFSIIRMEKIAR